MGSTYTFHFEVATIPGLPVDQAKSYFRDYYRSAEVILTRSQLHRLLSTFILLNFTKDRIRVSVENIRLDLSSYYTGRKTLDGGKGSLDDVCWNFSGFLESFT